AAKHRHLVKRALLVLLIAPDVIDVAAIVRERVWVQRSFDGRHDLHAAARSQVLRPKATLAAFNHRVSQVLAVGRDGGTAYIALGCHSRKFRVLKMRKRFFCWEGEMVNRVSQTSRDEEEQAERDERARLVPFDFAD